MTDKIKQFNRLLSSPYGILFILAMGFWYLSRMSDVQVDQLRKVLPLINTPIGWLMVSFAIIIFLVINVGKMLDKYLKHYRENTEIFAGLRSDLAEFRGDLARILEQVIGSQERSEHETDDLKERLIQIQEKLEILLTHHN